ncbi:MAG TPA: hypothetical protein VM537_21045 [Anaerolineae bacterium]|nr:hypothetical protein [Anaerolineae bacterium]
MTDEALYSALRDYLTGESQPELGFPSLSFVEYMNLRNFIAGQRSNVQLYADLQVLEIE